MLVPNAHAGAEDLPAPDMRVLNALALLDASPATTPLRNVLDSNRVAIHFVPMSPGIYARYSVARHTIELSWLSFCPARRNPNGASSWCRR